MLRITLIAREGVETLVVEGRLVGPWVEELRKAATSSGARSQPVQLDLAGVRFAAPEGVALLHRLVGGGARLLRTSSFVQELLRSEIP